MSPPFYLENVKIMNKWLDKIYFVCLDYKYLFGMRERNGGKNTGALNFYSGSATCI